jgi:hypothetical protein
MLIENLVDDLSIETNTAGTTVRMKVTDEAGGATG